MKYNKLVLQIKSGIKLNFYMYSFFTISAFFIEIPLLYLSSLLGDS